jgi:S1-C subfamily serine protease
MRFLPILLAAAFVPAVAVADKKDDDKVELGDFKWSTSHDERLGIMVIGLNDDLREYFRAPKGQGVLVAQVVPKSMADVAGIRVGDVITKFGNQTVDDAGAIIERMGKIGGNAKLAVEVIRERKPTTITVIVGAVQPKSDDKKNQESSKD